MIFGAGLVAGLLGEIGHALNSHTLSHAARVAAWAIPFEALYQDGLHEITANTTGLTGFLLQLGPFGGANTGGPWLRVWAVAYLLIIGALARARLLATRPVTHGARPRRISFDEALALHPARRARWPPAVRRRRPSRPLVRRLRRTARLPRGSRRRRASTGSASPASAGGRATAACAADAAAPRCGLQGVPDVNGRRSGETVRAHLGYAPTEASVDKVWPGYVAAPSRGASRKGPFLLFTKGRPATRATSPAPLSLTNSPLTPRTKA